VVNKTEIGAMLAYISELDQFIQPNEVTVKAWGDVLAGDMDSRWAKQHIVRHYGKGETTKLTPGILNDAWHWSRQRLASHGCPVCERDDHHAAGSAVPPNAAYIQAREALGHDVGDVLSAIEEANAKAIA
jgi:hypothetical protein